MGEFSFALENAITAETNRVKTICQNVSIRHGLTQNVTFTPVHLGLPLGRVSGERSSSINERGVGSDISSLAIIWGACLPSARRRGARRANACTCSKASAQKPRGGRRSLRAVAAELKASVIGRSGRPHAPTAIAACSESFDLGIPFVLSVPTDCSLIHSLSKPLYCCRTNTGLTPLHTM
jgi:hypothetical protein